MKPLVRTSILIASLILCSVLSGQAQEPQTSNADLLRAKIEQLEKIDIKSKSPTVQERYKATLLRLYQQFNAALLQDVAELKNIQATINGTNADPQNESTGQINKLKAEQGVVAEKLQTLAGTAATTANAPDGQPAVPEE